MVSPPRAGERYTWATFSKRDICVIPERCPFVNPLLCVVNRAFFLNNRPWTFTGSLKYFEADTRFSFGGAVDRGKILISRLGIKRISCRITIVIQHTTRKCLSGILLRIETIELTMHYSAQAYRTIRPI